MKGFGPLFGMLADRIEALLADKGCDADARELVGAFYGRARARHGDEKGAQAVRSMFASAKPGGGRAGHNMRLSGPLGRTRQTGPVKVPHFDMKPITRSFVPTSEAGKVHLPHGARPRERNLMLRGFVDMLARGGWMAVGVIHQPDPHADARPRGQRAATA